MIRVFILFSERTPPQKKRNYRLLILIIYTTFTSDLTSFRREPPGGKNRLSAKKMNFFPSAFYSHQFRFHPLFSFPHYPQTKRRIICIAINGNRLAKMFSLVNLIHFHPMLFECEFYHQRITFFILTIFPYFFGELVISGEKEGI